MTLVEDLFEDIADVTLIDEDTKPIITFISQHDTIG